MLKTWRLTLFAELKAIMQGNSNSEGLCFFLGAGADIASGGVQFSELKKMFANARHQTAQRPLPSVH